MRTFALSRQGYDQAEVNQAMGEYEATIRQLQEHNERLKRGGGGPDPQAVADALITAQATAREVVQAARAEAAQILEGARREADQHRAQVDHVRVQYNDLLGRLRASSTDKLAQMRQALDAVEAVVHQLPDPSAPPGPGPAPDADGTPPPGEVPNELAATGTDGPHLTWHSSDDN